MSAPRITRVLDLAEHHARGEPPLVCYREVEPASRSPAPAPDFLFGPSSDFLARQFFGQVDLRAVGCYAFQDAAVGPTGIAMKGQAAFCTLATHHPRPHVTDVVKLINQGALPERSIDGPLVALFGPAHDTYGHVLIDYLPKLWVLHKAGYDLARLRFLVPQGLGETARTLLRASGIADGQCVIYGYGSEIIRTDRLVVPTILRTYERLSPCFAEATRFWTSRVKASLAGQRASAPTRKKIFVSRQEAGGTRALMNRPAIEALAMRHGFDIVCPETLALADQVALFEGASQVAGEYGSALHNTVFSQPGTASLALRGTLRDPGCIQTALAASLGQSAGYVLGRTEGEDRDQRFGIEPSHFAAALNVLDVIQPQAWQPQAWQPQA